MPIFIVLLVIIVICIVVALKKKKPFYLFIPILFMCSYFIIQVMLVPLPFIETIKFIFSLR